MTRLLRQILLAQAVSSWLNARKKQCAMVLSWRSAACTECLKACSRSLECLIFFAHSKARQMLHRSPGFFTIKCAGRDAGHAAYLDQPLRELFVIFNS